MPPVTAAELFLRNRRERRRSPRTSRTARTPGASSSTESRRRAALWERIRDPTAPPHIGVLLDNTAEYLFWLGAAAITRSVVVGINATYRGAELAQLIDHTDCQVLVTSDTYADLLADGTEPASTGDRVFAPAPTSYARAAGDRSTPTTRERRRSTTTCTSSSSPRGRPGFPKAVRCTQGRFARDRASTSQRSPGSVPGKAVYAPLPDLPHQLPVHRAGERARGVGADRRRAGEVLGVARRCPTSVARARRCSRTPARSSTTSSRCRRRPTTPRRRSSSRSATRRRSPTSASSRRASTARSATATARPRG